MTRGGFDVLVSLLWLDQHELLVTCYCVYFFPPPFSFGLLRLLFHPPFALLLHRYITHLALAVTLLESVR